MLKSNQPFTNCNPRPNLDVCAKTKQSKDAGKGQGSACP
jgi:hypothetical protein